MLRYILVDTTMFSGADDTEETRKDLCWWLEALTQRNQDYLKQRPTTPRLYKSGVTYAVPKQHDGECEEVHVLRKALGGMARQKDVYRILEKMQAVFGGEHFCDIGRILEYGSIDCDGLACWRAAELRQEGIKARPYMTHRVTPFGQTIYHALVLWPPFGNVPYETSEDPSLLLGMGGPAKAAARAEEIRKNTERCEILSGRPGNLNLENIFGVRQGPSQKDMAKVVNELDKLFKAA